MRLVEPCIAARSTFPRVYDGAGVVCVPLVLRGIISVSSRVDLAPLSVVRKYTYDHLWYWLEVVFGLGCGEVAL